MTRTRQDVERQVLEIADEHAEGRDVLRTTSRELRKDADALSACTDSETAIENSD